jgi:tetratricopeptide (TPR) repeat protein
MILSARLMNERGEQRLALQTIQAALEIDPRYVDGWLFRGALHLEREEWSEALATYRAARQVDPHRGESYIGMASALARMQRWEEAVAAWEEARRANPGRADLLYAYGSTLRDAGRRAEAERIWRQALDLGSPSPRLLNDLAWLLFENGESIEAAERLSREAVRRDPTWIHVDTLLQILLARDKLGEAASVAAQAEGWGIEAARVREWNRAIEETQRSGPQREGTGPP